MTVPETIGYKEIARMIQAAAAEIRANHPYLSQLDSATGDGDHGTTINRVMDVADQASKADVDNKVQELLNKVGWDVMSVDGGSTSPLLGSFFMGMAEGVGSASQLNAEAVAGMFAAGLANLRQQTKAQAGDKTMLDALLPAIDAIAANSAGTRDIAALLKTAAEAAAKGAEGTKQMKAKFGRARNLGDRVIGHQDPGATSISYIFKGFAEAVAG